MKWRKAGKYLCKAVIFLLIGVIMFHTLQNIVVEKSSYGKYRNWKEQENVDILILGNSHADGGISPVQMEEEFYLSCDEKISIFNYALFGMRMEQMYFFVKELLKTQTPKLILLETYAFCPLADEHREILARRAFDVLPLSRNKVEAINYCVLEDRWSYYIPFMKYHTRWKEISVEDVSILYDRSLWEMAGKYGSRSDGLCPDPGDGWFEQEAPSTDEIREITSTEKECLEKMLLLLREKEVQLLFVSVPYKEQMGLNSMEMMKINNYLRENYVDDNKIRLLDMNRMWRKLEFNYDDLSNEGHVNKRGALKVTNCLSKYLEMNYDICAIAK